MRASVETPDQLAGKLCSIVGSRHVISDRLAMGGYVIDVLRSHDSTPLCVVEPANTAEVAEVVKACRAAHCAVVPIGGNTGLAGGAVAAKEFPAVLVSLKRLNIIGPVSQDGSAIAVQAGSILADVQQAAAAAGRLFPLSLTAEGTCQIGGNIATNAGGINALRYGMMRNLVLGLEVVLPDGQILDMMRNLHKDNSGYDLKHVFIGSGGTLGIVTAAVLKLYPAIMVKATAFMAASSISSAQTVLAKMRACFGERVTSAEIMDRMSLELVRDHAEGARIPFDEIPDWSLLIEICDTNANADIEGEFENLLAECLEEGLIQDATIAKTLAQSQALWHLRHSTSEVLRYAGTRFASDISVPLERLQPFVAALIETVNENFPDAKVCILGHIGDGNLHVLVCFADRHPAGSQERAALRREVETCVDELIAEFGGSVTAEHGIGMSYRDRLAATRSPLEIELMRQFKKTLDCENLMNPGKIIPD